MPKHKQPYAIRFQKWDALKQLGALKSIQDERTYSGTRNAIAFMSSSIREVGSVDLAPAKPPNRTPNVPCTPIISASIFVAFARLVFTDRIE